jgi:hypothetical protein
VGLYGGAGQGKVVFDGRPTACFTCHNGLTVFNDCEKCHRKI